MACSQRPSLGSLRLRSPTVVTVTAANIVNSVTVPKTAATAITSAGLCCAAGYMNSGINASHGPKTKIMNMTHGVIDFREGTSWTCA